MFRNALIALSACLFLPAYGQQPGFGTERLKQISATVEAVNQEDRVLVLRAGDNTRMLVVAGPDVRNLEQVTAGDRVVARYREALAAQVVPRGESRSPARGTATARAPEGERPGAATTRMISTTVTIDAVDTSFDTVTFKRPDGIVRTVAVQDPKATEFIRGLKRGDEVEITYSEAVVLELRPGADD